VAGAEAAIQGPGRRERWLPVAAALFIRALRASVRLRFHDAETIRAWELSGRRFVLAFWHRHMLLMRYAYRGDRMTVLSSPSRDGELMVRTLARLGIHTVRGSSSRGGAAGLRQLIRAARSGSDLGFTPDGPRGPLRSAHPGVVLAAAATGLPIVPAALAATRAKLLATWDRMIVPLPLSRVDVVYGPPLRVPPEGRPAEWVPRVEAALNEVESRAEALARGEAR
jgi:lysophospholipid acyltransferase (LPLAT)-like uncharacterized protein